MKNTFWTIFGENYFRIKNGVLLQAPVNSNNTVDAEHESRATSVATNILTDINNNFGSSFNFN